MQRPSAPLAALLFALCVSASCHAAPTQLVVVVDTDYSTPDELDGITVSAQGSSLPVTATGPISGPGALPATVSLSPAGAAGDVTVTASGTLHGNVVSTVTVHTAFVAGQTRELRLVLSHRCDAVTCPDATVCREGCCRSDTLSAATLPTWPGAPPAHGAAPGGDVQPACPIRAALYVTYGPGDMASIARDMPYDPAPYVTSDVAAAHIAAMRYAGIQAGVVTWDGRGTGSDAALPSLLAAAAGTPFRWAVEYTPEHAGDPSDATVAQDLGYLAQQYGHDPSFLRVDGRFVVFVYTDDADGCATVTRWVGAGLAAGAFIDMKIGNAVETCAVAPDAWFQYAPATPTDEQRGNSFSLSPGYCRAPSTGCLARDTAAWRTNAVHMAASHEFIEFITSFNDWAAGDAIENGPAWSSSGMGYYLDTLHALGP